MTLSRGYWREPARRLRTLETRLVNLWEANGYSEVMPPVLLPEETARALVVGGLWERTLRTHAGGEGAFVLRSDFTSALACLVGRRCTTLEEPLRVCYAGPVVRLPEVGRNGGAELWQAGCERVAEGERNQGDGEIVRLAAATVQVLEMPDPVLELGHWDLVAPLLDRLAWPAEARPSLESALNRKSRPALEELGERYGRGEIWFLLRALLHLGGTPEEVDALEGALRAQGVWAIWEELRDLESLLRRDFPTLRVRLDPTDVRRWNYYTGLTVKAFTPGQPAAVLSGGRYDSLYEGVGRPFGAVGFAVSLSALLGEV